MQAEVTFRPICLSHFPYHLYSDRKELFPELLALLVVVFHFLRSVWECFTVSVRFDG